MNKNSLQNTSRTDWARLDAMTDADIDTSDSPPLTEEFFQKAKWRTPIPADAKVTVRITLQLDPNLVAWFAAQGDDAEERMGIALREYAVAHTEKQPMAAA